MFNNPGFPAASTSSPFGTQSAFKPNTGFTAPVFGSNPSTSLFSGSTTQQSGGLFGSTATTTFGQPQTTQPAFGSSTGLFGGQQNATPTTGIFGSTTGSAFGQSKPFGFGTQPQTTGLFGQQAQPAQPQQTTLFGQPAQSSSALFGANNPGFGSTTATGGTTIKFTPVTGTDTMLKGGTSTNINTRHHCITCMKEYEGKSLEELRLEDYVANRKGPQQGTQGSLGMFGSSAQPSLFGNTTNAGFGAGTSNVFGAPSTGSSLFGKPAGTATAFGTPASTTTNTFGFNTSTASNPFGTNTANKPFGATTPQTGLFGQTTQASTGFGTQPTSGFGGFGTQQNTGGLFGGNKPTFNLGTNTNTAFSFNQPATTSAGSSLFGAKPATSSFGSFGTPATTATGFGTSAFGAQNQNTSIFGNSFGKPSTGFNFGTTPTTSTLGSGLNLGGGSLFGNTGNKPVFGQTNTNLFGTNTFGNTGSSFNTGTGGLGLGGGSLFGNTNLNNQQPGLGSSPSAFNNPISQHMLAYASMPFGDSPLFKNLLPQTGKADELLKPTSPAAQKALLTGQNYKASPKNNSKIKVVPIEAQTKKSLFDGLDGDQEVPNDLLNQSVRQSPKRLVLRTRPFNELSLNQRNLQMSSNIISEMSPIVKTSPRFTLRTQLGTSGGESQGNVDDGTSPKKGDPVRSHDKISLHIKKSLESTPLENTMVELVASADNSSHQVTANSSLHGENLTKSDVAPDQPSTTSSSVDSELEDTVPGIVDDNGNPHPTRITLKRLGYYTIPKLDLLAELVDSEGRCIVENFTIGRLNYGNLFFPDSMDVAGLNLDEIVHFRHKEVVVYPDDNEKPPVGEGLNRRAQVTLDRVWPVDKTTRMPITEPTRIQVLDYENKLRRACAKHNTKFVEYRPQTGSWVFKVDHFSKYGLSDSDEEDGAGDIKKQKLAQPTLQGAVAPQFPIKQVLGPAAIQIGDEDEDMDDGIRSPFDLDEKLEGKALSPTSRLGKEIGASSHKVQLMKASFFEHPDLNIDGEYLDYDDILEEPTYKASGFSFDSKQLAHALSWYNRSALKPDPYINIETEDDDVVSTVSAHDKEMAMSIQEEIPEFVPKPIQPKMFVLKHWKDVLPYEKTTIGRIDSKCLVDVGIMKGRSFTIKWGPRLQFTALSTACSVSSEDIFYGRLPDDTSAQVVQTLSIQRRTEDSSSNFQVAVETHLLCALKHSVIETSDDGCPYYSPKKRLSGLHEHCAVAAQLLKGCQDPYLRFSANVWALCQALWGALQIEDNVDSHLTSMQRKSAVSDWLKSVVAGSVAKETCSDDKNETEDPKEVFSYMTGYQVAEACEAAQNIGDHQMSMLISQCRSGPGVRVRAHKQLIQWKETEADQFIDTTRLKLMMLVAGIPVHEASDRFVNACSDLDWLRIFALHLWYMIPFTGSLTDALIMYDKSFCGNGEGKNGCYSKPPFPPHLTDKYLEEDEKPIYDVQYHLLKLFSAKSHPLEPLLNPSTYSQDHLDYTLSWLLMRVLSSLGYSHVSDLAASIVHTSFAEQLEAEGLWHWAVFVLLHLPDPQRRKASSMEIIQRHVSVDEKCPEEEFLLKKLNVPTSWVYQAKAMKAVFFERYDDAAKFLIKAQLWNDSHTVIINHISSKAIINEKYEYLEGLLKEIGKEGRKEEICNWDIGGGVILDYLSVVREVERMVAVQDLMIGYHLEQIQPQLTDLCLKIKLLPTTRPIDRLSQAEMAKRISGLVQNLIVAHWKNESEEGVNVLAKLVQELPLPGDHSQWEWLRVMASWRISALPTS